MPILPNDSKPLPDEYRCAALVDALTERERQVMTILCTHGRNKAISTKLDLSLHTVNNHLDRICAKFGVKTRMVAAAIAAKGGLV
jgi:DNA-binding CsgD family transcriptional regulator